MDKRTCSATRDPLPCERPRDPGAVARAVWRAVWRASWRLSLREFVMGTLLVLPWSGGAQAEDLLCPGPASQPLPVVTGLTGPVAPLPPTFAGHGMCMGVVTSTTLESDVPQEQSRFHGGMNDFIDAPRTSPREDYVFLPYLNVSNHQSKADLEKQFRPGTCFPINDDHTSFAMRARGFLAVTPEMVDRRVHFGVFCDDACSLVIHDGSGQAHPVVLRPPALGAPAWRSTNTVIFPAPGLYPIELLYVQIAERANLEVSMMVEGIDGGSFCDVEASVGGPHNPDLPAAGFKLLGAKVVLSVEGEWPSGEEQCRQCRRDQADSPGNGGCGEGSGLYCNAAALCAPCTSALRCGPQCVTCPSGWECDPITGGCQSPPPPLPPPPPSPPKGGTGCSVGPAGARPVDSWSFGLLLLAMALKRCGRGTRRRPGKPWG